MAVGDTVSAISSVAAGAYLTIQPGSGAEWIVHNISVPSGTAVELYFYNGTNEIKIESSTSGWIGYFFHCTNTNYYRVKNTSTATAYFGYDGIVSK